MREQLARICRELPERFVAIAPGAVYGPAKAWPAERYRELARGLRDRAGVPVLLLGTSDEHALAEQVRDGEAGILNWCGTTDLPGLVAVLSRAALLVSNDSGAMHVMAALRRPQVAIFGSTSPVVDRPDQRESVGGHARPAVRALLRAHLPLRALRLPARVTAEQVLGRRSLSSDAAARRRVLGAG